MIIDIAIFLTKGINAARVTVAHEFHHAIQLGNYSYRDSDLFFYELTSTSMEEFVFNSVNDYYNYLTDYFYFPQYPLAFAPNPMMIINMHWLSGIYFLKINTAMI